MTDQNNKDAPKGDDYKDTLFLPQSDFPMRAGLPQKEPTILETWWDKGNLYKTLIDQTKDRAKYILHWGPPFANGHLHMGHVLSYVVKDVIIRSQFMLGKQAPSVTGWDCHGLPIEWMVEKQYREKGKDKDDVPVLQFREECRQFAMKWKEIQGAEMKRLGIVADWDNPYLTMANESEAAIAAEALKFAENGLMYRALRPVMWSTVEKTALAEAETEYKEHTSTTIYVSFKIVTPKVAETKDAEIVIWTTTPWTIPANRMIGVHNDIDYGLYEVQSQTDDAKVALESGRKFLIATDLAEQFAKHCGINQWNHQGTFKGADLIGTQCAHPFRGHADDKNDYYGFNVGIYHGDFVTTDAGTGFVHCAPSHGKDDFDLGRANGIEPEEMVNDDGTYCDHVGLFAGLDIYDQNGKEGKANGAVISALFHAGALVSKGKLRHEYPHSWRSKAPLIFRATPQWYIQLDTGLRETALGEIKKTEWFPKQSINRITAMVEGRPDWCISRQRVWGVPIPLFVHKETKEVLVDSDVNQRIIDTMIERGADAWYGDDPQNFLGDNYSVDDYEQVKDVIDVWFESGSTHAFVCEARDDLQWPADLYMEGNDQHRGWFQSSLLESCGTRGQAPYKQVMTHGMVLDKDGRKMSKSLGNGIDPMKLVDQYGADIIRLWCISQNFMDDMRISNESIKVQTDLYRRFRNTLRYLLGNLDGFNGGERVDLVTDYDKIPDLEKWVLHRLAEVGETIKEKVAVYDFYGAYMAVHELCNQDLSAFYFDIRKDRLYLDRPDLFKRRVTRSVLEVIYDCLTTWLAPFIPFTMEETWGARPAGVLTEAKEKSVHQRVYPTLPEVFKNKDVSNDWERIREIRSVITGAIEVERAEKRIRSSLEAHPTLYLKDAEFADIDWAEIAITSQLTVSTDTPPSDAFTLDDVKNVAVVVNKAEGQKCERSWKILLDVGSNPDYPTLSARDADAVSYLRRKAG